MLSRRELLMPIAAAPFLPLPRGPFAGCEAAREVVFAEEPHLLSAESAGGYRALVGVQESQATGWIIAPGIRNLNRETGAVMLSHVRSGGMLLLESGLCFSSKERVKRQLAILEEGLGLRILTPVQTDEASGYVSYSWPISKLVRGFQAFTPVVCDEHDVIARVREIPVCAKRKIGEGCLIYLGSLLGSGLMAEEREAHAVGNALFTCAGARSNW